MYFIDNLDNIKANTILWEGNKSLPASLSIQNLENYPLVICQLLDGWDIHLTLFVAKGETTAYMEDIGGGSQCKYELSYTNNILKCENKRGGGKVLKVTGIR